MILPNIKYLPLFLTLQELSLSIGVIPSFNILNQFLIPLLNL